MDWLPIGIVWLVAIVVYVAFVSVLGRVLAGPVYDRPATVQKTTERTHTPAADNADGRSV